MPIHAGILTTLEAAFGSTRPAAPPHGVFLIARLRDPSLNLPRSSAHIFLPDCHLVTQADAAAYPGRGFQLKDVLTRLLQAVRQLKRSNSRYLYVWQLGDLFDLWRAAPIGGDPQIKLDKILAEYGEIVDLLRGRVGIGTAASVLPGNHDFDLGKLALWKPLRMGLVDKRRGDEGADDVLLLHGDIFSWIEGLPDFLQEAAIQVFTRKETFSKRQIEHRNPEFSLQEHADLWNARTVPRHELLAADLTLDDPVPLTGDEFNVVDADDETQGGKKRFFYKAADELARKVDEQGAAVRAVVIGHTHRARIVRGRRNGKTFVLMDCGAWVGESFLSAAFPAKVLNAQIGVLADDELRVYQIGCRP